MALVEIKDFRQGLNTFDDPEDSGQLSEYKNFNIRKTGVLETRKPLRPHAIQTTSHAIYNIWHWTNRNSSVWVFSDKYGTSNDFYILAENGTTTTIADFNSHVERAIISREAFRAICADGTVKVIKYNDDKYFFGSYDPTNGLIPSTAALEYPTSWVQSVKTFSGTGSLPSGHHWYKIVPIFDGVQEALFDDSYAYKTTAADSISEVKLITNEGNYNQRITGVKIYRAHSNSKIAAPSYYFIKEIAFNTESTHNDIVSLSNTDMGLIIHVPGVNFLSDSTYDPYNQFFFGIGSGTGNNATTAPTYGNNNIYTISSKVNEYLILSPVATGSSTTQNKILEGENSVDGSGNSIDGWDRPYTLIHQSDNSDRINGSGAFGGQNVVIDRAKSDHDTNRYTNWVAYDTPSNNITNNVSLVEENYKGAFKLDRNWAGTFGTGVSITMSDGYRYEYAAASNTSNVLYFYDNGYVDGAPHHLDGVTKAKVNYKYGVELNGRMFVGNVVTDPDDEAKSENNWIMFSELGQPDVIPLDNYIAVNDPQGGEITGVVNFNGDLVVFCEKGIFRLDVPSLDPSGWSLSETSPNIGCIAPDSIIQHNGVLYFMGYKNMYALMPNFNVVPIGNNILDKIEANTVLNRKNAKFEIDYKNETLLARLTGLAADETLYTMHLPTFQFGERTLWGQHVYSDDTSQLLADGIVNIVNDDDLNTYLVTNDYSNSNTKTTRMILVNDANGAETRHFHYKTNYIQLNKISKNVKIRKINITHKGVHSSVGAKLQVFVDKSSSAHKDINFPTDDNETDNTLSVFRVGCRAKYIQLAISSANATAKNIEIYKIEIEYE